MNNPIFSSFFNKKEIKLTKKEEKEEKKEMKKTEFAPKRDKSDVVNAGGNSRASKKRKKKLEAKRNNIEEDADEGSNNGESEVIDKKVKGDKPKRAKGVTSSDISHQKEDVELESGQSIMDLLNLKDIDDIDAYNRGAKLLASITCPCSRSDFFSVYYEKQPFVFRDAATTNRFKGLFNKQSFERIIKENALLTSDVVIATANSAAAEDPSDEITEVKSKEIYNGIRDGHLIRLLCPQKYDDNIWKLLSALEIEFGSTVTCNAHYHTSNAAGTDRGFNATEATDRYVLQVEGQCKYQVWNSKNDMVVDKVLAKGDVLYIPRGLPYRHCLDAGSAEGGASPSLNLHLITNDFNSNSVSNLLEGMLSQAIQQLGAATGGITSALPHQYHRYLGVAHSEDDENPFRNKLLKQFKAHLNTVASCALDTIDAAADQQVKQFLIDRLPVPMTEEEEQLSSWRSPDTVIHPYTKLRLLRPGIARAIVEDGMVVVYHCMDNSRELHGASVNPLEYDLDDGPCIEELLLSYPHGVTVADLTHPSEELDDKVSVAQSLYKEGILLIDDEASKPARPGSDEDSDSPF